jgi:diguanylate cyclase (GGDEF)-like protein
MKILIAEDEAALRQNLQWMLEMEGFEVIAACDGREAYAKACALGPDLIITDVMMPNLDGYGLVKALREHPGTAALPIIMLSAKADRGDVRTGMNIGADDYLTKPYRREELLDTVQARLARSASLTEAAMRLRALSSGSMSVDPLTSLPSREHFEQRLTNTQALCAQDNKTQLGVMCFRLDGFAKINETLGKAVGDTLLCEAAQRLLAHVQAWPSAMQGQDTAARLSGDLFAMYLTGHFDDRSLEQEARRIQSALAAPYVMDERTLFLTASAGASIYSPTTEPGSTLLINAESALFHAGPQGPGAYQLFDPAMTRQLVRKLQLHNDLHSALRQGELQVYYQPQVHIETGALAGFEALLRWPHPTLGWISPVEFIPIAEESGLIVELGEWVMRMAAAQAVLWTDQGHTGFRMTVNLSVRQFAGNKLPGMVEQVLQDLGLAANILELEVTESLALENAATTMGTLNECQALGVQIAMDDFGTGYSSLSYLKRYPLDALKIDQSFVRNITRDVGDAAIARAIVAMAHSFNMSVIAEGVETTEQLAFLKALGCEYFQGYLFSKPVPAEQAVHCFGGYHP